MILDSNKILNQSVVDFYAGRTVLVTGGTGFLGKVIIEKLIYSCPQIKKVYVLTRDKNSQNVVQRIQRMTESQVFARIREERPEDLGKIVPIAGDIVAPNLGIKYADEERLIEEVSVVFHSAATVRFNEPLKVALTINLEGTQKVLRLCQRMKSLKVFVHLSTAYSNTHLQEIDEVVYPPPAALSEVYDFVRRYGDDQEKTAKLLNGRPNTYTFTKALAENLLAEKHGHVPVVIIRPSIVTPSMHEPVQGWTDNWYGSSGLLTTIAKGICRVILGREENILDLIPVDYVSNLTVISAAKCHRSEEVVVLNSCSGSVNPLTLRHAANLYTAESIRTGFNDLPFPGAFLIMRYKWILTSITVIMRAIAYVADLFMRLRGRKPRYVKIQSKADFVRDMLEYFTSHSWVMRCDRARALYASLCARDRQVFPCDPARIDWTKYIPVYFQGVKRYLLDTRSK